MDTPPGNERESAVATTGPETHRTASQPPTAGRDRAALVGDSNRDSVRPGRPLAPAAAPRT